MFEQLELLLVAPESTIAEAMQRIDQTVVWTDSHGLALIVDSERRLLGLVTDGDIRRALLHEATLNTPINLVMNREPIVARPEDSPHKLLRLFDKGIKQLPVVDEEERIVDLLLYSQFSVAPTGRQILWRAKAPVRISFAGGGTDLTRVFEKEGGGVISATIDRYSHAFLVRRSDRQIRLHSLDFNRHVLLNSLDEIRYDGALDLLKAAIRVIRPAFGFDLYTYSEVPPGSGLGSSSAMTVAVVGLLYELSEGQLDRYRIADLAYQAERVELGMQGGWQDQYAAAFGGFNFIEFDRHDVTVHSLRLSEHMLYELESNLLLCFTGQTRDSGQVHAVQQRRARSNSATYRQANSEMLKLVTATKKALLKGDLVEFGRLLDVAWQTKKNLAQGVSNNFIDRLYAIAREQGASGGKLLGAGSGGFLLFYCQPLRRHLVKQALEQEGVVITTFKFDPQGLQVWHSPHPPEADEPCKP